MLSLFVKYCDYPLVRYCHVHWFLSGLWQLIISEFLMCILGTVVASCAVHVHNITLCMCCECAVYIACNLWIVLLVKRCCDE